MSNSNFEIDVKEVVNLFADLSSRQQSRVYKRALKKASLILVKAAKKELRKIVGKKVSSKNWWNGKTLQSGIRSTTPKDKDTFEAKVHILGDFRLKFFEMGTVKRTTSKGSNRGSIKARYFFRSAKAAVEQEVFSSLDRMIAENIKKISEKNSKRR